MLPESFIRSLMNVARETLLAYSEKTDEVIQDSQAFSDKGIDGDIVDTGRLLESKEVEISDRAKGISLTAVWNPVNPESGYPYAHAVHSGFFAYGKKYIPARKWPERAAKELDIVEHLAEGLETQGFNVVKVINNIDELED